MEGLKEFLSVSYGSVSGSGYGYGSSDGSGDGYGYGDGGGGGYGSVDGGGGGYGDGYGDGYGGGSASGSASAPASGFGDDFGFGDGDGDGLKSYLGKDVHYIDGIPSVILQLKSNIAKGYVVNKDLTTDNVFIAKVGNSFAHGITSKDAVLDAQKKHLNSLPVEERVDSFNKEFRGLKTIPAKDLFEWHFTLTGSCKFGREQFIKDNNINLNKDSFTVLEFVNLTKDSFGGEIIKQLIKNK